MRFNWQKPACKLGRRFGYLVFVMLPLCVGGVHATQTASMPRAPKVPTLTLRTQPQAQVWVDEILRGTTDDKGQLAVPLKAGRHVVRVRAYLSRTTSP